MSETPPSDSDEHRSQPDQFLADAESAIERGGVPQRIFNDKAVRDRELERAFA
jgi:hypothetical protein